MSRIHCNVEIKTKSNIKSRKIERKTGAIPLAKSINMFLIYCSFKTNMCALVFGVGCAFVKVSSDFVMCVLRSIHGDSARMVNLQKA